MMLALGHYVVDLHFPSLELPSRDWTTDLDVTEDASVVLDLRTRLVDGAVTVGQQAARTTGKQTADFGMVEFRRLAHPGNTTRTTVTPEATYSVRLFTGDYSVWATCDDELGETCGSDLPQGWRMIIPAVRIE